MRSQVTASAPASLLVLQINFEAAFLGLIGPLVIAAAILAVAFRPWIPAPAAFELAEEIEEEERGWGGALAVGVAFAVGFVATQGWPPLPPDLGIKHWLFYAALGTALIGAYEALADRSSCVTRGIVSFAAPFLMLARVRRAQWNGFEATLWLAFLTLSLIGLWTALDSLARKRRGATLPMAWCLCGLLAAGALQLSGSFSLAQLAASLASALVPCAVLGLWRPSILWAPGAIAPFCLTYLGLVWGGHFSAELSFPSFLLLAVAPLLPALAELPRTSSRRSRAALAVLFAALPALVAVLIEYVTAPEPLYG